MRLIVDVLVAARGKAAGAARFEASDVGLIGRRQEPALDLDGRVRRRDQDAEVSGHVIPPVRGYRRTKSSAPSGEGARDELSLDVTELDSEQVRHRGRDVAARDRAELAGPPDADAGCQEEG